MEEARRDSIEGSSTAFNDEASNSPPNAVIPVAVSPTTPEIPQFFHENAAKVIMVSYRQKGNPLLQHIRNVPYEFGNIVPDYLVGKHAAALFISLKYHRLYPTYLQNRILTLQKHYRIRLLLCHVDLGEPDTPLREITLVAFQNNITLFIVTSPQEAARALETFKAYEQKPADAIQAKLETNHSARALDALTAINVINKTDAVTLSKSFGTMKSILLSDSQALCKCVGIGTKKMKLLRQTFHEPFFTDI